MQTGIVIFAHGSSVEAANQSVRKAAEQAARAGSFHLVETAFLELAQPDLDAAVAKLIEAGAGRILIIPYFLTLGIHLQKDLPALVEKLSERHPGVQFRVAPPLDGHPALAEILVARAREQLGGWQ